MTYEYNKVDLQRQIDYLENRVDFDTINHLFLWNEIERYFPFIPVGVNIIKKGEPLFRGRPTKAGPSFKKIGDFSHVPIDEKAKCKEFGRCNLPAQSLFIAQKILMLRKWSVLQSTLILALVH